MWDSRISVYLCSLFAMSHALTPAQSAPETTSESHASIITYYSPVTTFTTGLDPTPEPRLDLRAAPAVAPAAAAPAVAPAAPAPAVAPAAPAAPAVPAAAQPAAVAPGVAPAAAGVGGAGAVPPAAQPAAVNPAQVPTITTYYQQTIVDGVSKQVAIVYTQKFSSVPSQGPTPQQGTIGLGTLTGTVGAVETAQAKKGAASKKGQGAIGTIAIGASFAVAGSLLMWA